MSNLDDNKIGYDLEFPASMSVYEVLKMVLHSMESPLNSIEGGVELLKDLDRVEFHEDAVNISHGATLLLRILQKAGQDYLATKNEDLE